MTRRDARLLFLAGCLGVLAVFFCLSTVLLGGVVAVRRQQDAASTRAAVALQATTDRLLAEVTALAPAAGTPPPSATPSPFPATITLAPLTPSPVPASRHNLRPPASVEQAPVPAAAGQSLAALLEAEYPPRDYYETAVRLGRWDVGPRVIAAPAYVVNDRQLFRTDEGTVTAVLVAATEHAYFWVEDGLDLDRVALGRAARRFEETYYPPVAALFGQEWQPGVDDDPRFSVLHLSDFDGGEELGYFVSADEYPRTIDSRSNQQEIVYLNMSQLRVGGSLYFGTLVHEFQHLIHWYVDPNEATWLDEGLSQLAEVYVGLNTVGTADYLRYPGTQLNAWSYGDEDALYAHYGAAYLFAVYFWEQLGETAVQELARHPDNGLAAVRSVLRGYRPETTLEAFVAEWMAATYLDDATAGPQYHYQSLALRRPSAGDVVRSVPYELDRSLAQFGAHFVELDTVGATTISFAGDTLARLIPVESHSGEWMWLAPAQDNLNARLTAVFNLSGVETATLTFWSWYDLEAEWDFAYVAVSDDEGASWDLLSPKRLTLGEYGPGFNGRSADAAEDATGWTFESLSLDSYAGGEVWVRFEALTDASVAGRGFAVDDIAIPELNYSSDVETDDGRWLAEGFVRSHHRLPQRWFVQLIEPAASRVTPLSLDDYNQGQWTVDIGREGAVLAIVPLTPFVSQPATYWLHVEQ